MKRFFVAIIGLLLVANLAPAKGMSGEEVSEALTEVQELIGLKVVKADQYDDGSCYIILGRGNNAGVKISRFEIKDLEKYLTPKKRVISEPEPKIVEKIIEIPGPERVIEKEVPVEVPGPTRFIVREALPTILIAGAFFLSGRIAEDRYERSLEPEISKKIEPGHAQIRVEYKGKTWLRDLSNVAYATGGITLSIPIFKKIF